MFFGFRSLNPAMIDETERQIVLTFVSLETAFDAVAQVASCENCNPDAADFPFECVLDRVTTRRGWETDYFMLQPPPCPRCKMPVTEKTLVECDSGIEVIVRYPTAIGLRPLRLSACLGEGAD